VAIEAGLGIGAIGGGLSMVEMVIRLGIVEMKRNCGWGESWKCGKLGKLNIMICS